MLVILRTHMDIDEAAGILQGPRTKAWSAAVAALCKFVEREARNARVNAADAEDIAQKAILKLLPRLQQGEVPWNGGGHRAYLRACVKNGVIDKRRRDALEVRILPEDLSNLASDGPDGVTELIAPQCELLRKVADVARARRAARYRKDFDAACRQLELLVCQETPLRVLLEQEGALPPEADEATLVKARNRVYKAHERVRAEVLAAIGPLLESEQITSGEAERARAALQIFVRCQRRTTLRVSDRKGKP